MPDELARPRPAGSRSTDAARDWFERLYVAADDGEATVPWDRGAPHRLLEGWAGERQVAGQRRRALVVESLTVQSLPRQLRSAAIARVRRFVAPGGTLRR